MVSLGDPKFSNPVLSALQIKADDKVISVRENSNADSNFILTHLMKQILYDRNKLCLVNFHNTINHYQMVGKKLGYDLLKAVEQENARLIEPINLIVDNIGLEENYFQPEKENIVKCLYLDIKKNLEELITGTEQQAYLLIDDLSHLNDLNVDVSEIISFLHYCVNLTNNYRMAVVLNNHVASKSDELVSNSLQYIADVHVEVSALKTGRSQDVTGLFTIERHSQKSQYQFKAFDRGIRTFHPGESIHHLYK